MNAVNINQIVIWQCGWIDANVLRSQLTGRYPSKCCPMAWLQFEGSWSFLPFLRPQDTRKVFPLRLRWEPAGPLGMTPEPYKLPYTARSTSAVSRAATCHNSSIPVVHFLTSLRTVPVVHYARMPNNRELSVGCESPGLSAWYLGVEISFEPKCWWCSKTNRKNNSHWDTLLLNWHS